MWPDDRSIYCTSLSTARLKDGRLKGSNAELWACCALRRALWPWPHSAFSKHQPVLPISCCIKDERLEAALPYQCLLLVYSPLCSWKHKRHPAKAAGFTPGFTVVSLWYKRPQNSTPFPTKYSRPVPGQGSLNPEAENAPSQLSILRRLGQPARSSTSQLHGEPAARATCGKRAPGLTGCAAQDPVLRSQWPGTSALPR